VFKLASCDGCQLTLLNCEDELLAVAEAIEIAHFPEASSTTSPDGPFDLVLVEGSVSTPDQLEEIRRIRSHTPVLATIGACATAGGIQALRNFAQSEDFVRTVYADAEHVRTLATATPVAEHVEVDFELRGCPIDKHQLLELVTAFLVGRKPALPDESVCMECKRRKTVCVAVTSAMPCLGPVTHAGCGALCPALGRACYGCFGPREGPNTRALAKTFSARGLSPGEISRAFRLFASWAPEFREESERHG
jgi:coenzyme F420-reducing hydrogenase gamma subunit